jgi:hypothetical protein
MSKLKMTNTYLKMTLALSNKVRIFNYVQWISQICTGCEKTETPI